MLAVDPEILQRFPTQYTAVYGPAVVDGNINAEVIQALRGRCAANSEQWAAASPPEVEHWRGIFARMGAPSKLRSSVDALYRRFVRSGDLPRISPIVDLYNWLSLATSTPMAVYDADHVNGVLSLRPARAGEPFEPLGAPGTSEPTADGEVVYADALGVVCRYWNWRDCHRTRVRDETRRILFVADLTADAPAAGRERASEIAGTLSAALGHTLPAPIIHPQP
jgi:DNA/RNA-binding domain of Phe-tRNA-synthetase-like protein